MSAVVDDISNMRTVRQGNLRVSESPPNSSEAPDSRSDIIAKTLDQLRRPTPSGEQELIKNRFLCRAGGLLLVGHTGIGKSSLSMQLMISWALGKKVFDLEPARPLTSLLIQAENDEEDLSEMIDGVFSGLNVTDDERRTASSRIHVVHENTRTSDEFFQETVRPMLEEYEPDLLWIDPALSFLGGENNSQEDVGAFLRNQLNPMLKEFDCAGIIIHHTNKPSHKPEKRAFGDFAYSGAGSAEWANWARAILTVQMVRPPNVFELRAAKRGGRLGWKEADGVTPAYTKSIAHNKEPNSICWFDVEPDHKEGEADKSIILTEEVLKHVPQNRPIAKNLLMDLSGIGEGTIRGVINELVKAKQLYEWQKPRKGTRPEVYLARIAQPKDALGKLIFTEMFTVDLIHEKHHEDENERSSRSHAPLGAVKNDREDRQQQHQPSSALSVTGTNGHEDGCPRPPAGTGNQDGKDQR